MLVWIPKRVPIDQPKDVLRMAAAVRIAGIRSCVRLVPPGIARQDALSRAAVGAVVVVDATGVEPPLRALALRQGGRFLKLPDATVAATTTTAGGSERYQRHKHEWPSPQVRP